MRILFIGGTGTISTACTELIANDPRYRHHRLSLLTRGERTGKLSHETLERVELIKADIRRPETVRSALGDRTFDAVVQWVAFTPDQIRADLDLFEGRCGQYVFISSASAYQKPVTALPVTESTPLVNPYWEYSRNKIACEDLLMARHRDAGFPITIVRPSHTYGDGQLPVAFGAGGAVWTIPQRILDGRPVIVPGDGCSLWTLTHNSDFARGFCPLLGHPGTTGQAVHITSDESLTWDQIYRTLAAGLGVANPLLLHVSSDFIVRFSPGDIGGLLGDKSANVVFDNTKIKSLVPDFVCHVPWHQGVRRSLAHLRAQPDLKRVNAEADALADRIASAWTAALPGSA